MCADVMNYCICCQPYFFSFDVILFVIQYSWVVRAGGLWVISTSHRCITPASSLQSILVSIAALFSLAYVLIVVYTRFLSSYRLSLVFSHVIFNFLWSCCVVLCMLLTIMPHFSLLGGWFPTVGGHVFRGPGFRGPSDGAAPLPFTGQKACNSFLSK